MCRDLWLFRWPQSPQAKLRLFVFPYAGAGASTYYHWTAPLGPEIAVTAIQLPGRENRIREAALRDVEKVAAAAAAAIGELNDLPFAFFGHSMGALLAFETARMLRSREAAEPVHIFVSGRQAPHLPPTTPPIHGLPDAAFLSACLRRYQGIPAAILNEPELLRLFLGILRADFELIEKYQFNRDAPLPYPITALHGTGDATVTPGSVQAWSAHTSAQFVYTEMPGGHFFVQTARREVLDQVKKTLL